MDNVTAVLGCISGSPGYRHAHKTYRTHRTSGRAGFCRFCRFCRFCGFCGVWQGIDQEPRRGRSAALGARWVGVDAAEVAVLLQQP